MSQVLLLSGPNLNLLGEREPHIYGTATLDDHVQTEPKRRPPVTASSFEHFQIEPRGRANRRGACRPRPTDALIVNAGALSHTSWSLHDAVAAFDGPVVELHISNPAAREPFRHASVLAPSPTAWSPGSGDWATDWPSTPSHALLREPGMTTANPYTPSTTALAAAHVTGRLDRLRAACGRRRDRRPVVTTPANVR